MRDLLIGVDVGTGSARAGVLTRQGRMLGRAESAIELHRPQPQHAEYDSEQIWAAVCAAVRSAMQVAGVTGERVAGIGFDATCSLVVRDTHGDPLSVSSSGEARWDAIAWLDHRAIEEAEACTATAHRVLSYVGGVMSPEMEIPKLMWLKRAFPERWANAGYFFDLADFLTWKASGSLARSQCTLTCKWTYLSHEDPGWQADFLAQAGLPDLLERGGLPGRATPIGEDLGPLTAPAAAELGLSNQCRVGAGLIDAPAGALGVLGARAEDDDIDQHLVLIAGTSGCIMALSPEPRPIPGVWGPYLGAVVSGRWLTEGGQSATGALLEHLIRLHGAGGTPSTDQHERICRRIGELRRTEGRALAHRLHVLPDFHGNRSPLADPHALGVVSGLDLDSSFDSLCRLYWRTAVGIALGVRHILEALNARGYGIHTLHVTGGHLKNPVLMELYADATGCTVIESQADDAMLLGAAIAAGKAAGLFPSLPAAARAMRQGGRARAPDPAAREQFQRDYAVFLKMHEHRRELDRMGGGRPLPPA